MISYDCKLKISCLLVTANGRFEYLKKSYKCYLDQKYSNKELVIVNDGDEHYQNQIKELVRNRNDVKLVFLKGKYSLGALRNISVYLSEGDIFVQWDDDDFNLPERLSIQLSNLLSEKKYKFCYLSEQLHYFFDRKMLYWNNWKEHCSGNSLKYSVIPGTIMAWKKHFNFKYPIYGKHSSAGEDSVLLNKIIDEDEDEDSVKLVVDNGNIYMYSYHGKNTYDLEHHLQITRNRSMDVFFMNKNKHLICKMIDYLKLSGNIKVMSRDGLVFKYNYDNK